MTSGLENTVIHSGMDKDRPGAGGVASNFKKKHWPACQGIYEYAI